MVSAGAGRLPPILEIKTVYVAFTRKFILTCGFGFGFTKALAWRYFGCIILPIIILNTLKRFQKRCQNREELLVWCMMGSVQVQRTEGRGRCVSWKRLVGECSMFVHYRKHKTTPKSLTINWFITTYDPRLPSISKILIQNWKVMIESDKRLRKAFPKPRLQCCATRDLPTSRISCVEQSFHQREERPALEEWNQSLGGDGEVGGM